MGNRQEPPVRITRVATPAAEPAPPQPPVSRPLASDAPVTITRVEPPDQTGKAPRGEIQALNALFGSGRIQDALEAARVFAERYPATLAGWTVRGAAARALGLLEEAEQSFRTVTEAKADFAPGWYNLALVRQDRGNTDGAIHAYRQAIEHKPDHVEALNNLGILLTRRGEMPEAIAHLERTCSLRSGQPDILNSLGNAYERARRTDEARRAYLRALEANLDFAMTLYNLGVLEETRGDAEKAVGYLRRAVEIAPEHVLSRASLLYQYAQHCDWDAMAEHRPLIPELGVKTAGVPPWPFLAYEDNPERQMIRNRKWAADRFNSPPRWYPARPKVRPGRLRIGYFSADFKNHPAMHLMAGMFAAHDRERFEIHGFSYSESPEDEYRRIARERTDHFHDVAAWDDKRIVEFAREQGIDIAIDRGGYTKDSRSELLSHWVAPIQINYLGYPSTMAADFIDYAVFDPVVVPERHRAAVTEKIIRMPLTYFPSDDRRAISDTQTTRADWGLPDDAFVFCCFNATYKITPDVFAVWMRLLYEIEGSVLWLYRSNPSAERNLKEHARRAGIAPERVILADRRPVAEHLARHAHADLMLDTFNLNAHTTTSDALWGGLPVVTKIGEQVAARVAAAMLRAVGLPELVTETEAEYEALALALARDHERLGEIRARLAVNRTRAPFFDTALYTRQFEAGLDEAYRRWMDGEGPADIDVAALV